MQFIMALDTEDHGFSSSLNHLAFPWGFACKVSEFTNMVYLNPTSSDTAPFAFMGEQAFS